MYAVRLWAHGAWRCVVVDDRLPTHADGTPLLPHSADPTELWPALLSKALFKLRTM